MNVTRYWPSRGKSLGFGAAAGMLAMSLGAHAAAAPFDGLPCRGNGPKDVMVRVGPLCVDKYEASVWSERGGNGTRFPQGDPRFPATFPNNGNWTEPLYAASVKDTAPAVFITWFQAQQACALSGKRLLTNAEWQMAAAGTPDPGINGDGVNECDTNSPGSVATGAALNCASKWGVRDMVGNVNEWVADWVQGPGTAASNGYSVTGEWHPDYITQSTSDYGNDGIYGVNGAVHLTAPQSSTPADNTPDGMPGAIVRGGMWTSGQSGGVFAYFSEHTPSSLDNATGFRCGK
jgi:formylglycine-generating enzyme required for sulfatase activity